METAPSPEPTRSETTPTVEYGEEAILHDEHPEAWSGETTDSSLEVQPLTSEAQEYYAQRENTAREVLHHTPQLHESIDTAVKMMQIDLKRIEKRIKPLEAKVSKKKQKLEKAEKKYSEIYGKRTDEKATWRERYYKSRVMNLKSDKSNLEGKIDLRQTKIDNQRLHWWKKDNDEVKRLRKAESYKTFREMMGTVDKKVKERRDIIEEFRTLQETPEGQSSERYSFLDNEIKQWGEEPFDTVKYRAKLEQEAIGKFTALQEKSKREEREKLYRDAENKILVQRATLEKARNEKDDSKRTDLIIQMREWPSVDQMVKGDINGFKDWVITEAGEVLDVELKAIGEKLEELKRTVEETLEKEVEELQRRKDEWEAADEEARKHLKPFTEDDNEKLNGLLEEIDEANQKISEGFSKEKQEAEEKYKQRTSLVEML